MDLRARNRYEGQVITPQILWDVITCPCSCNLLLVHKPLNVLGHDIIMCLVITKKSSGPVLIMAMQNKWWKQLKAHWNILNSLRHSDACMRQ